MKNHGGLFAGTVGEHLEVASLLHRKLVSSVSAEVDSGLPSNSEEYEYCT